jgi:hypothetical protein
LDGKNDKTINDFEHCAPALKRKLEDIFEGCDNCSVLVGSDNRIPASVET